MDNWEHEIIHKVQLTKDLQSLYGALQSSIKKGKGLKELLMYEDSQDGLKVWLELVKTNDKDGSRDLRISKLESIISLPYNRYYKGGLARFVNNYESAFVELGVVVGVTAWLDDENMDGG